MKFYSGFSLQNDVVFFDIYLQKSKYCVCGFSYGAIAAFSTVIEAIKENRRVDTLQLFSPAFFQTRDTKFKRLQLMSYRKNQTQYKEQFIRSCFAPYAVQNLTYAESSIEELQELLEYEWSLEDLKTIAMSGVKIEVYLGAKDAIIDVESAREFFIEVATVTYIKDANHFLQLN